MKLCVTGGNVCSIAHGKQRGGCKLNNNFCDGLQTKFKYSRKMNKHPLTKGSFSNENIYKKKCVHLTSDVEVVL